MQPRGGSALTSRNRILGELVRLSGDRRAATAVEYAMIASGVAGVIAATFFTLGGDVNSLYTSVSELFQ